MQAAKMTKEEFEEKSELFRILQELQVQNQYHNEILSRFESFGNTLSPIPVSESQPCSTPPQQDGLIGAIKGGVDYYNRINNSLSLAADHFERIIGR